VGGDLVDETEGKDVVEEDDTDFMRGVGQITVGNMVR
jgi:hypothetical protein